MKRRARSAVLLLALAAAAPPCARAAYYALSDLTPEEELGLSTPTAGGEAFPGASLMTFDQDLWNEARTDVEEGREPGAPRAVEASTAPARPRIEEGTGFINVDLPYESGLSIAGRKLIAVKVQETRRRSAQKAREQGLPERQREFDMRQELQVKIKGKVGRKIAVNVDFDDTKDDKRDISVVYTGDPGEVVQEAAFGDLVLSLPSTEFVSYSKQLFGVRTKLQYKNAQIMAIGSRTKGVTETKRFNGNVKFERKEINDTSYIRRRYYDISFVPGRTIRPGTVRVWRDDVIDANNRPGETQENVQVRDFAVSTATFAADLDLLVEGQGFSLDLSRGLLILTQEEAPSSYLAIDYVFEDGGRLSDLTGGDPVVIKARDDRPMDLTASHEDSAEAGFRREVKTFYAIGQNKIVPDDGRGNFLFKTQDLNRNDNLVFLSNGDPLRYPDNVEVDFINGRFNIERPLIVDTVTVPVHRLYEPTPEHRFTFIVEYRYKVRSYIIKPGIVFGSERVTMNGRLLSRDVDYFMDYDSGFLTFFNDDQFDETSQIEVTYEYAPFGGQLGETLVGTRAELDLVPGRFKVGSTSLFNFAPKPRLVPDVRSAPRSLQVIEADGQLKDWKVPFTPATLSLAAEVAKSKENPNLYGKALVDSMEGVRQEVQAAMGPELWRPGTNPGQDQTFAPNLVRPDALWTRLSDEQITLKDIVSGLSSERENDKVRVMTLPYQLQHRPGDPSNPEWTSIVQSLSRSGIDFSKRLFMELWIEGACRQGMDGAACAAAGGGVDLEVNVGQFNEDVDKDGLLDTEDANFDGSLNFGEDDGWLFNSPGSNGLSSGDVVVGPGNARLDTEDIDGDGALRIADSSPRGASFPIFRLSTDGTRPDVQMRTSNGTPVTHTNLNFSGWRLITVPLNIAVSEEPEFQAIKQVRVSLVNRQGGSAPFAASIGTIRMAKLAFIGTTWEKPQAQPALSASSMTLTAVNNIDTPGYLSLLNDQGYKDLYGDEAENRTREQALSLRYGIVAGSTVTTRQIYPSARDFSFHRTLNFFLQIPAAAAASARGVFTMQLGSENDYYEYTLPLSSRYAGTWVMESLRLTDLNDDGTPDILEPLNPQGSFRVVGSPSFQRIGQIKLLIHNDGGAALDGELLINEIHLSGSRKREGNAQRFAADLVWPGWGAVGGRVREVDRDFQTLTAQVLNQDRNESSANASFTRLSWLPMSGNVSKSETVTPAVFRTGQAGLVSLLSEGRETSVTGRGDGQLLLPGLPAIGFSYDKALAKSTSRNEKRDKDTYTGSADYQVGWAPDVLPTKRLTLRPLPQTVFVKYSRTNSFFSVIGTTGPAPNPETEFQRASTLEMADEWTTRAPFALWDGLTFQPGATWRRVRERRRFADEVLSANPQFSPARGHQKAQSQSFTYSGSWRMARWLEPRFDGELTGGETNNLPTASSPTAFNQKLIDRTARGNFFWTFRAADLAPGFKPTQSLRLETSYRLESGDAYENVGKDYYGWRDMRPFSFKRINRRGGRRMYGLLEPLDVAPAGGRRKQLTTRNSLRTSLDWTPFDWLAFKGRSEPLRTFRMTATLTNTDEHTETGEAVRDAATVVWPDLLFSVRDTERFFRAERWMRNSQLNLRTSRKETETFGEDVRKDDSLGSDYHFLLRERYDAFLAYSVTAGRSNNLRTGQQTSTSKGYAHSVQVGTKLGAWQVTPRGDFRGDKAVDSAGRVTQDARVQAYSVLLRLDKAYPRGFRVPFTRKVFTQVNRLIIDGKVGFERRESGIDIERNNTDAYTGDMSGEWEVSRHFRLSFGGGVSVINNRVVPGAGVISFNLNSQLVINF